MAPWQRSRFEIGRLVGLDPLAGSTAQGGVGEWLKPAVCKIAALTGYAGSNPAPSTRESGLTPDAGDAIIVVEMKYPAL